MIDINWKTEILNHFPEKKTCRVVICASAVMHGTEIGKLPVDTLLVTPDIYSVVIDASTQNVKEEFLKEHIAVKLSKMAGMFAQLAKESFIKFTSGS